MLEDFSFWLENSRGKTSKNAKELVSNLTSVWKCVDPDMKLIPNFLGDTEKLEDQFFFGKLKILEVNLLLKFYD